MKDQIKVAIITILIFISGLVIGIWTQRGQQIPPPPPFGPMAEWEHGGPGGPDFGHPERRESFDRGHLPPPMPPEHMKAMRAKMEQMKPQMEEFQKKLEAIRENNKNKMLEILREDQKTKFNEIQNRRDQMVDRTMKGKLQMPFGKGGMSPMVKHFEFLSTIIYKPLLDRMSEELNLDDAQKKTFEHILVQRRQDVLNLIDTMPLPSMEAWDNKPPPPPVHR
ncbi:MAG: hypothetical protein ACOY3I_03720 [Verrucomicrobiota bacterium]